MEDGEQAVLVKILEKMLKKHQITSEPQHVEYQKNRFRPSIEDKLRSLDVKAEMGNEDYSKNYKKDYMKQIKDHI